MSNKPQSTNSLASKEIDRLDKEFKEFDANVKALTQDQMNMAPRVETEPQTKIASLDIDKKPQTYLKPARSIGCRDKFNEKFRAAYEFDKEFVNFIAENNEIIGETIDIWTRPYGGMPAEYWNVPTNKPVWGPRYLAEQIKRKTYHRLIMQQNVNSGSDHNGQYYGTMAADTTIERLTARPVSSSRSVFMGSKNFS